MMKCYSCHKEQEDSYYTRDRLACDDCTLTEQEVFIQNKAIAEMVFGVKL